MCACADTYMLLGALQADLKGAMHIHEVSRVDLQAEALEFTLVKTDAYQQFLID